MSMKIVFELLWIETSPSKFISWANQALEDVGFEVGFYLVLDESNHRYVDAAIYSKMVEEDYSARLSLKGMKSVVEWPSEDELKEQVGESGELAYIEARDIGGKIQLVCKSQDIPELIDLLHELEKEITRVWASSAQPSAPSRHDTGSKGDEIKAVHETVPERRSPGRKPDKAYDKAFQLIVDGMSDSEAFDIYCESESIDKPYPGLYEAFQAAMKRRRKKLGTK
jgi:hypothetical protein